jgi:NAD(P)H-dependent FMN reductase
MPVILALSGSLRAASLNTAVLRAAAVLAPAEITVLLSASPGRLPLFNPDLETTQLPGPVAAFRAEVAAADALLIASPEYAHGVSGVIKNALDWLVGGPEFVAKPVALINTSARASIALAALEETLRTMAARLLPGILIPMLGHHHSLDAVLASPVLSSALSSYLAGLPASLHNLSKMPPDPAMFR